jgi:hypothetical protein
LHWLESDHMTATKRAKSPSYRKRVKPDVGADIEEYITLAQLVPDEPDQVGLISPGVKERPLEVVAEVELQPKAEPANAENRVNLGPCRRNGGDARSTARWRSNSELPSSPARGGLRGQHD